jgi:hypothetical protein
LTEFLFAQFLQSENLPVSLKQLQAMIQKDKKTSDIVFKLFGLVALFGILFILIALTNKIWLVQRLVLPAMDLSL